MGKLVDLQIEEISVVTEGASGDEEVRPKITLIKQKNTVKEQKSMSDDKELKLELEKTKLDVEKQKAEVAKQKADKLAVEKAKTVELAKMKSELVELKKANELGACILKGKKEFPSLPLEESELGELVMKAKTDAVLTKVLTGFEALMKEQLEPVGAKVAADVSKTKQEEFEEEVIALQKSKPELSYAQATTFILKSNPQKLSEQRSIV